MTLPKKAKAKRKKKRKKVAMTYLGLRHALTCFVTIVTHELFFIVGVAPVQSAGGGRALGGPVLCGGKTACANHATNRIVGLSIRGGKRKINNIKA